ncbi:MAG TPA: AraC family transcriptional regulator [Puia sp.]|nr:AraC family transcriptional regulator [Puia sp.]
MTHLYIKNMVCNRCIYTVRQIVEAEGLHPANITLGEVQLPAPPTAEQLTAIRRKLHEFGFEILDDQKHRVIEKIKTIIIEHIHQHGPDTGKHPVFSKLLAAELHKDYSALSKLFSEAEGITIEKYIIQQKIEKVKEWLAYDELTLSEIADRLGYSSVAHLSAQFKKTTGFTPSAFRKQKDHHRRPLDRVGKE